MGIMKRPARKAHKAPPKPPSQSSVLGTIRNLANREKAARKPIPTGIGRGALHGLPNLLAKQKRPVRKIDTTRRPKGGISVKRPTAAPFPMPLGLRPARKRWRETLKKPGGFKQVDTNNPPDPIEAFIDIERDHDSIYHLMRATIHAPDHDADGECAHPPNASSFVSCIGLVVLKQGRLGIYSSFWRPNGAAIVYVFNNDQDAIDLYFTWRAARSKGKWLHAMVYNNPYIRVGP